MMTIKAEALAGTEITKAFKDAIKLAEKLECYVEFEFNQVTCFTSPGGNAEKGAKEYHKAISNDFKFANAN